MDVTPEQELLDWMGSDCWFCRQRSPEHGRSRVVKLRKTVGGDEPGSVKVLYSEVAVPRCAACAAGHERAGNLAIGSMGVGMGLMFVLAVLWNPFALGGWLSALAVVVGGIPGMLMMNWGAGLSPNQLPDEAALKFKAVVAMRNGGWEFDELDEVTASVDR